MLSVKKTTVARIVSFVLLAVAAVLLIATIASTAFYTYMLARPISYGMSYSYTTTYEDLDGKETFVGTMTFNSDETMEIRNTNLPKSIKSRYYYKNGYVFFTVAETEEEYKKEVEYINANFDEAIEKPLYADKINAFRLVATEGDGYEAVYTCASATTFAIVGGIVELVLFAATLGVLCASVILLVKSRKTVRTR